MPYADVSDIIGRRNLVEEAHQFKQLKLQERELALKEEKARKEDQPDPFDYSFAPDSYAVDNPYQQELFNDLAQQHQDMTYADMNWLIVDPSRSDQEGLSKHSALTRRNNAYKSLGRWAKFAQEQDDTISKLLLKPEYNNKENYRILMELRKDWRDGHQFSFDENSNLVIKKEVPIKAPLVEEGKTKYISKDGKSTTFDPNEAKQENGKPVPVMVETDQTETQVIPWNKWWDDKGLNKIVRNVNKSEFTFDQYKDKIITTTATQADVDEGNAEYVGQEILDRSETYKQLEPSLFGEHGWNDETGVGRLPYHSQVVIDFMKQEEQYKNNPITKQNILDYISDRSYAHYMQQRKIKEQDKKMLQETKDDKTQKLREEQLAQLNQQIDAYNTPLQTYSIGEFNDETKSFDEQPMQITPSGGGKLVSSVSGEVGKTRFMLDNPGVTLLRGNKKFNSLDKMSGKGSQARFEYTGAANFRYYKGEFITDEEYSALDETEKAKTKWKTAVMGSFVAEKTADGDQADIWRSQGLIATDSNRMDALIEADQILQEVTQDPNTRTQNGDLIQQLQLKAAKLNEQSSVDTKGTQDNKVKINW